MKSDNQLLTKALQSIENLEIKISYYDDNIDELNKSLGLQHIEMQQMHKQIQILSEFIKSLTQQTDANTKSVMDEAPPPHY